MYSAITIKRADGTQYVIFSLAELECMPRLSDNEQTLELGVWQPGDDGRPEMNTVDVKLVGMDAAYAVNASGDTIGVYYGYSKGKYRGTIAK